MEKAAFQPFQDEKGITSRVFEAGVEQPDDVGMAEFLQGLLLRANSILMQVSSEDGVVEEFDGDGAIGGWGGKAFVDAGGY